MPEELAAAREAAQGVSAPNAGAPQLQRPIGQSRLVTRSHLCGRYTNSHMKFDFCRYFAPDVWATGLGHEPRGRVLAGNV
jgi:hypothetical protein